VFFKSISILLQFLANEKFLFKGNTNEKEGKKAKKMKRLLIPELEMFLTDILPQFSCKRCARCCTGKLIPLYVSDIERIKPYVKRKFYEKTTITENFITGAKYKMVKEKDSCIFLDCKRCKHYNVRPDTCRRHPFLVTEKRILVSATCPGIIWDSQQSCNEYRLLSAKIATNIESFLKVINF